MNALDWSVLAAALGAITIYGVWKTRGQKNIEGYLRGDNSMPWWMIALSVMATQASAITFMSTPGQAYQDGMGFLQFYFGLPLAMIVICMVFLPKYSQLKVYTAYEFLESRFNLETRTLTAILFLVQRGLAAGITIYAPAIILSSIMRWSLNYTCLAIGILVIIYTVAGGTKAVSQTQKQQMIVIFAGMFFAFFMGLNLLPENISFTDAMTVAGEAGKTKIIDWNFDMSNRYNVWSGILGGFFLALSYFGTDQSQVARYISGKSLKEMRIGLILNGLIKIPMQFFILLTGVLVFVVYQFNPAPSYFNQNLYENAVEANPNLQWDELEQNHESIQNQKQTALFNWAESKDDASLAQYKKSIALEKENRKEIESTIKAALPDAETKDTDYVFISYVLQFLPHGIIGLLLAVIFSAAMSSTSSEINALASTTVVDLYKRFHGEAKDNAHYLKASKFFTVVWGITALFFALIANLFENLIQAVNILGSLFYGTILGVFLIAFFLKKVSGRATFVAAIIAELTVIILYFTMDIGFLWFNVIGCTWVMFLAHIFEQIFPKKVMDA